MSKTKSKHSTCVVYKTTVSKKNGKEFKSVVGYLSNRDEQNGLDISLDMKGYTVVAL